MRIDLLAILSVITIYCLVACGATPSPSTIACSDIDDRAMAQLLFNSRTTESMKEVMGEFFDVSNRYLSESEFVENPSYSKIVRVEINPQKYNIYLRDESTVRVQSEVDRTGADIDSILRCFGEPDYYYARYQQDIEARVFVFSMWYVDEGIVASTSRLSRSDTPPELERTMIIQTIDYVQGDTLEAIITDAVIYGTEAQFRQGWLDHLKPWAPSWEVLIIDNEVR